MRFFHNMFTLDLRSLALLRVGTAAVLILDLVQRWSDLAAHYSDAGILPRQALLKFYGSFHLTIHTLSGEAGIVGVLFAVQLVFAMMLLVGYRTRLATIVSWALLVSLQNRNPAICYGGDSVMRMLLFWGMFLPWGLRFALDAGRLKVQELGTRALHLGTIGYVLQIALIYWSATLLKNGAEWITDFSAVYYALALDELKSPFTDWLYNKPPWVHQSLTVGTLAWEGLGPFLLLLPWWRTRLIGVLGFLALHIGFGLFMRLGIFPYISCVCVLGFLPAEFWDRFAERTARKSLPTVTLFVDGTCGFCQRAVAALQSLLVWSGVEVVHAQTDAQATEHMNTARSWVLHEEDTWRTGYDVFPALVRRSRLWWWSWKLWSAIKPLGKRVYRCVADRRDRLRGLSVPRGLQGARMYTHSTFVAMLCMASLVYVVFVNVVSVSQERLKIPQQANQVGQVFKIVQNWSMFAPYPYKSDGWYIIDGRLNNGTSLDLMTGLPITEDKPAQVSAMFKNTRWSKYYRSLRKGNHKKLLPYWRRYFVNTWNADRPEKEHIDAFNLVFMHERTRSDYQTPVIRSRVIYRYRSSKAE